MGRIKAVAFLTFIIGLIYMHVNGYENRAHRNFEAFPDQAGEMQSEIPTDQPLWFRNMNGDGNNPITKVTAAPCFMGGPDCFNVVVDLQDRAAFIVNQSTIYKIKLNAEHTEQEAGEFTVRLIGGKAMISWNADKIKRGRRTNEGAEVNQATMH